MASKASAAKTPVRRAATTPRPSATRRKTPRPAGPAGDGVSRFSPDERQQLICLGAYYRAEARGFGPGRELEDWLEAEGDVDNLTHGRNASPDAV